MIGQLDGKQNTNYVIKELSDNVYPGFDPFKPRIW